MILLSLPFLLPSGRMNLGNIFPSDAFDSLECAAFMWE